jgi:DNA ligase-associated metallophosphoesterase
MHARITVEETALFADPSGALFWPARRTLVVADLHLEKGSAFAARGTLLPPYDTRASLLRLQSMIRKYTPARVVCLGDSFHDVRAGARIAANDLEFLGRLIGGQDWVWVTGNHDPEIPAGLGGVRAAEIVEDKLALRHEPAAAAGLGFGEIVGHFHPKAAVVTRGGRIAAPCFALDGRRLVMPAFGAYAGGLDVLDPAIARLFGRAKYRVLLLGKDGLHLFTRERLVPVVVQANTAR